MIEDGVEKSKCAKPDHYFKLLRYSGFYYGFKNQFISRILFAFSTLFIIASLFFLLPWTVWHTLSHSKFSTKFASFPITVGCITQQTLNALILYLCQRKNLTEKQILPILKLRNSNVVVRNAKILLMCLCVLALTFIPGFLIAKKFDNENSLFFNYDDIFPHPFLAKLARFLSYYQMVLVLIVQFYFHSSTGIVCNALNEYNVRFEKVLKQSASIRNSTDDKIRQLHEFHMEHLKLCKMVRGLDVLFNVYTFSVCATSIPVIVFSLWTLLVKAPFIHLLVTLAELSFSIVSLGIVCVNPIRIRAAVQGTKLLIFYTMEIWDEYNPTINDICRLFISHIDEEHLGITVWHFVLITKSFILSIISITTTFLIFIVESNSGSTSTHHMIHHATKLHK